MTSKMLHRKDHRSKVTTSQQVTALVRLSEAKDAYDNGRVGKDSLCSTARTALIAGVHTRTIAEVSGMSRAAIEDMR